MKKNVFLVTTSIKKTFPVKKKENVLLAGEWCKTNINTNFLNNYKVQILPFHWDNEKKKAKDAKYLKKIYNRLENDVSIYLNKIHNTKFSKRYWSIIISPWLSEFIVSIFDKYAVVKKIKKEFSVKNTKIINFINYNELIPQSTRDARMKFQSNDWNHYIFSLIIKKLLVNKKEILKINKNYKIETLKGLKSKKKNFKQNFIKLFYYISGFLKFDHEIFIINSYLGFFPEILLNFKLNKNIKINQPVSFNQKLTIDKKLRSLKFQYSKNDDEFSKILKDILPRSLPAFYLEGYKSLSNFCLQTPWAKNPKLIFTSNNHLTDEVFKFWAAAKVEKNKVPLVFGQHGGSFFTSKYSVEREIEIKNSDKFLSWGNPKYSDNKTINFYNLKSIFRKQSYEPNGKINLVQGTPRAFQKSCISGQLSFAQARNNVEFQKNFLRCLKNNYLNKVKVRLYSTQEHSHGYQEYEKSFWLDKKMKIELENFNVPIVKSIAESRLLIHTALESTLFLESMHSNVPSILLMDFDKKFIKRENLSIFKLLKDEGILHDNPRVLSNFINLNFSNIDIWWKGKTVQKAVQKFCNYFSAKNPHPIQQFQATFKNIINQSTRLNLTA